MRSAHTLFPEQVRLPTARPDNLIIVENHVHRVLIRAARDNFDNARKACFIRYLAAEGYIPERFVGQGDSDTGPFPLRWVVDHSLARAVRSAHPPPVRQVLRVIVYAILLWLGLMAFAFLQAPH
jgi:hypothetical protein